ncbi:hypothetical protein LTR10_016079 [Elasticomyces elasticus]|uniref:C2H2-type domain-containing protein n=1 Tax=Exophiala sideris TaxID=1016849 RepID=A0ABR0J2U9_9EURO|nr:hypothetical protein LTR10_016079 [Elasticomyces elasticus]KAK5024584.1 hypothetical protein LTS07_008430 [Exophiala sideris]KAK5030678.1 hypothetical protein LTR13_008032 [Exophiala sideris]KAK5054217.1 hypothetical protein LTR69_008832 [Exophiala sideris]KAK5179619.1 hypothetical protein LTR44_007787 [Eurotiomycetes sp. CCFEE 6388]
MPDTKERPYQCPVCKKYFSRSDVLRRHQKNHQNGEEVTVAASKQDNADSAKPPDTSQDALSARDEQQQKGTGPSSSSEKEISSQLLPDDDIVYNMENDLTMTHDLLESDQTNEALSRIPEKRLPTDHVPSTYLAGEDIIDVTASGDVPSTQKDQRATLSTGSVGHKQGSFASGIAIPESEPQGMAYGADISLLPSVPPIDDFQLGHSTDMLDSWLFQYDPTLSMTPLPDLFPSLHLPNWVPEPQLGMPSADCVPSDNLEENQSPRSRFTNKVSERRFQKIQSHWHSRSSRATRLMPNLWQELAASGRRNLYCKEASQSLRSEIRQRQVSRWGFDDDCRQQMQFTLNSLTQAGSVCSPQSSSSAVADNVSRSGSATSYSFAEAILPSTETCEVALEIYFHQFHPTLPCIHIPTFSAKSAEFPMLFVLCLIGFSILGTPSATKLVSDTFPMVIQLISSELQSTAARKGSLVAQLNLLATGLLALNLASITGQNSRRMAQAETLYVNLISIAQWHGLFSANGDHIVGEVLERMVDDEARWHAWSKIECVKRLMVGLVEIDDWFASYFSTSPMIRSETLQILPPADNRQFHASTCSIWMQLRQKNQQVHTPYIGASFEISPEGLELSALPALLTLHQHQIYEANHRLVVSTERQRTDQVLEPWRLYENDAKDSQLLSRLAGLPSTSADPLKKADINGVISWHMSCMMLTANMRLFEEAAGMNGSTAVGRALDAIAIWTCTPTARRAVLHAAQVFKLLFHRRVSDVISVHAVAALFKSALVLSFYLLMAPHQDVGFDRPLELFEEIDWFQVGSCGISGVHTSATNILGISQGSHASLFVQDGGAFSITGIIHPPGYPSCGRVLLHAADLMQTLGKWKSRTFSQILHLLTDDLMDIDAADGEDADGNQ